MHDKPYDARIAFRLVYPLRNSSITPNWITTLRLLCGILAFIFIATGEYLYLNIGALFFVLSHFLDHADGELARITNHSSRFGHYYDLISDVTVNILLFVGIGFGLIHTGVGGYAIIIGAIVGCSIAGIFHLRHQIEQQLGKESVKQPNRGGFEIEDILYLLPIITLFRLEFYFLLLASFGAPVFFLWVIKDYFDKKIAG